MLQQYLRSQAPSNCGMYWNSLIHREGTYTFSKLWSLISYYLQPFTQFIQFYVFLIYQSTFSSHCLTNILWWHDMHQTWFYISSVFTSIWPDRIMLEVEHWLWKYSHTNSLWVCELWGMPQLPDFLQFVVVVIVENWLKSISSNSEHL